MRNLRACTLLPLLLQLAGCAAKINEPVIEDKIGRDLTIVSMVAQRRMVFVNETNKRVCAEPSPDVSDSIAQSMDAALKGGYSGAEGEVKLAQTYAAIAKQLVRRSQGLQLYRDGMYYLCQAWLNETIDDSEYTTRQKHLMQLVENLIEREIPSLHKLTIDVSPAGFPEDYRATVSSTTSSTTTTTPPAE